MNKELEEAIKKSLSNKERGTCVISAEILETVLNHIKNSISKEVIEEKVEKATEEYNYFLDNIDRKTSHMKDEHKIRATYAEFGVKRGRLEVLQELLEGK